MEEPLLAALDNKNPQIKAQSDQFLYRAFKKLNAQTMPKKTLKALIPVLIKVGVAKVSVVLSVEWFSNICWVGNSDVGGLKRNVSKRGFSWRVWLHVSVTEGL